MKQRKSVTLDSKEMEEFNKHVEYMRTNYDTNFSNELNKLLKMFNSDKCPICNDGKIINVTVMSPNTKRIVCSKCGENNIKITLSQ